MKKTLALLLAAVMLFASCSSVSVEDTEKTEVSSESNTQVTIDAVTEETDEDTIKAPELPEFNGETFTFGIVDNVNMRNTIVIEELNGEALNDARFETLINTNDELNISIAELVLTNGYPSASSLMPFITAGDDTIQVANVFCVDALTLMSKAYIRDYSVLENIDLTNPWWDKSVNEALTFAGMRYGAIGDFSISTHDLTYILLFSDKLVTDNNLESPYSLVWEGRWTMDKMAEMMESVLRDANGNGKRDEGDIFGYLSHYKMVLPGFWVGAGERTLEVDPETNIPALAIEDERFMNIFNKVFEITYDNEARFKIANEECDCPIGYRNMFANDQALFLDSSFFYAGTLREMENDFGIIPYPKYDENQEKYYARVSYFMPPVIPVTNENVSLTGAVLEEINYQAKLKITHAYYEVSLKGKYARDPESIEMLDMIFANRFVDLGDSLFCVEIRDGFMRDMYNANDRNLASKLKTQSKMIGKIIEKAVKGVEEATNVQG